MGRCQLTLDCTAFQDPDLVTLDALLHLRLELKRAGIDLVLLNPAPPLGRLISLCGVGQVLDRCRSVEPRWQPEERE